MPSPPPSPTAESTMLDIDVAQAKEETRRSRFDVQKPLDSVRKLRCTVVFVINAPRIRPRAETQTRPRLD